MATQAPAIEVILTVFCIIQPAQSVAELLFHQMIVFW